MFSWELDAKIENILVCMIKIKLDQQSVNLV